MKLVFTLPKLDLPKLLSALKRNNLRPSSRRASRFKTTSKNGKLQ